MDHIRAKNRGIIFVLGMLVLAGLACNAPTAAQITPTPIGQSAPTTTVSSQPTATTPATQAAPATSPSQPTTPPQTGDPAFIGPVYFSDQPSTVSQNTAFPAGVEEIWAIWNYANMRDGVTVRRVWYKDGEVWVEREEKWNFAKYGANGTVTDISIYDRDHGLEPGKYELHLYIDGKEQYVSPSEGPASFLIYAGDAPNADRLYPGGTDQMAIVRGLGTLIYKGADGQEKTLAQEGEIEVVQWFPDNQRLLYVALDRSMAPQGPTFDWKWRLWAVVLATGEKYPLSEESEKLHNPIISPQGDIIALTKGSDYFDAGAVDTELVFMYLDAFFKRNTTKSFLVFDGIPPNSLSGAYPIKVSSKPYPGEWVGIGEFHAAMQSTFNAPDFDPGIYAFFTKEMIAKRIGDLPPN